MSKIHLSLLTASLVLFLLGLRALYQKRDSVGFFQIGWCAFFASTDMILRFMQKFLSGEDISLYIIDHMCAVLFMFFAFFCFSISVNIHSMEEDVRSYK